MGVPDYRIIVLKYDKETDLLDEVPSRGIVESFIIDDKQNLMKDFSPLDGPKYVYKKIR